MGLVICFAAVALAAVEVSINKFALKNVGADYSYNDPYTGQCNSGASNVSVTGLPGASCSSSSPCPTNYPPGTSSSVQGECVLEMNGASSPTNCALICQPSGAGVGASRDGCPTNALCQPIQGVGVCTYVNK